MPKFHHKEEQLTGKTIINTDVSKVVSNLITRDKKWVLSKYKEINTEKYKNTNIFPTIQQTFEKMQEMCATINFSLLTFCKTLSENTISETKKKVKLNNLKMQKTESVKKMVVSVKKWTDQSEVELNKTCSSKDENSKPSNADFQSEISIKSNEKRVFSPSKYIDCLILEKSKSCMNNINKTQIGHKTHILEEDSIKNHQQEISTSMCEGSAHNSLLNFVIVESPIKKSRSPSLKKLELIKKEKNASHKKQTEKQKSPIKNEQLLKKNAEKIEEPDILTNVEKYIEKNKSKLTNLDLAILNSMTKCYSKIEREHSRYDFASKSTFSKLIIHKCGSFNSLIESFFQEETELFKQDTIKKTSSEKNKYFELFNQSYTFELLE